MGFQFRHSTKTLKQYSQNKLLKMNQYNWEASLILNFHHSHLRPCLLPRFILRMFLFTLAHFLLLGFQSQDFTSWQYGPFYSSFLQFSFHISCWHQPSYVPTPSSAPSLQLGAAKEKDSGKATKDMQIPIRFMFESWPVTSPSTPQKGKISFSPEAIANKWGAAGT